MHRSQYLRDQVPIDERLSVCWRLQEFDVPQRGMLVSFVARRSRVRRSYNARSMQTRNVPVTILRQDANA